MEIEIKPEDIEKFVKDALIKSAIGTRIINAVDESLGKGYDNPIDKAVKEYVLIVAKDLVQEKFTSQIREAVTKVIETQVTPELITQVVTASVNKMARAAEDSRY